MSNRPHIVLVVARGEAVRNFIHSDTLKTLADHARVTLLSAVDHPEVLERAGPYIDRLIPLKEYPERFLVTGLRYIVHNAHLRWMWTEAAKYYWGLHDSRARTFGARLKRVLVKSTASLFANRPCLSILTRIERYLSWRLRATLEFDALFREIQPDLVFNCSHIHGPQADLPLRVAHALGIQTVGFIFSWDNLTSRSRIFAPYDHYLVWTEGMKRQLLELYPEIPPSRVHVTGTPQFDFHFKPEFDLGKEELSRRIGLDPQRPFILYTTGMDTDFPFEHRIVEAVASFLARNKMHPKPQLVVRTYVKGTSPEMQALATRGLPDVVFPEVLWDRKWVMPLYEDLKIYSSLLHHTALGINAASTVSLELILLDKPVINLGFEPPGTNLPHWSRFSRHVEYEHYRPLVASGAVMVARSISDLEKKILTGLARPDADHVARRRFVREFFGEVADGQAGIRVAYTLLNIAEVARRNRSKRVSTHA